MASAANGSAVSTLAPKPLNAFSTFGAFFFLPSCWRSCGSRHQAGEQGKQILSPDFMQQVPMHAHSWNLGAVCKLWMI